jgi:hypothetical protein
MEFDDKAKPMEGRAKKLKEDETPRVLGSSVQSAETNKLHCKVPL